MIADHDRIGTGRHCQLGVLDIKYALEYQLAAPFLLDPGHVIPGQGRIKLAGGPLAQRHDATAALDMPGQIAKSFTPHQRAQGPGRFGRQINHIRQRKFWWHRHAVL